MKLVEAKIEFLLRINLNYTQIVATAKREKTWPTSFVIMNTFFISRPYLSQLCRFYAKA
jgi:hypothetical protein